jgi:hypothetical protein
MMKPLPIDAIQARVKEAFAPYPVVFKLVDCKHDLAFCVHLSRDEDVLTVESIPVRTLSDRATLDALLRGYRACIDAHTKELRLKLSWCLAGS